VELTSHRTVMIGRHRQGGKALPSLGSSGRRRAYLCLFGAGGGGLVAAEALGCCAVMLRSVSFSGVVGSSS